MSELYMHFPDETALCRCDNCGHECQAGDVGPIADFEERVAPGEICPAGECPECGCLMHPKSGDTRSKVTIWAVCTTIPQPGEPPCMPSLFITASEAETYVDGMIRGEWGHAGIEDDDGNPMPYPGDWRQAQDLMVAWYSDGSWGTWEITSHRLELDAPRHLANLARLETVVREVAGMSTPEDEIRDMVEEYGADVLPRASWATETPSDEEFFIEMDSVERQAGEYQAFMMMVRKARAAMNEYAK